MVGAIRTLLTLAVLALCVVLLLLPVSATAQTMPAGFEDQLVTSAVDSPTALAFFPNGDLLITAKDGQLWFLPSGGSPSIVLNLGPVTCTQSERGLLGVAIHPAFNRGQNWIYLYYTARRPDDVCVNRVSRFRFAGGAVNPGTEQILLNNMPSTMGNHNGGDVQFGRDGNLYVSIGEGGVPGNAPRRNVLSGKILRITADGGIPAGNPFHGRRASSRCHQTGRTVARRACREIFALGLRNPFRIAHDPNSRRVRFFINDVGQGTWEEIDRGVAGAHYGWPVREGPCEQGSTRPRDCGRPPRAFTNPIHAYRHSSGCRTITGGAFVPAPAGWPAAYGGNYLFADFICGVIFRLDPRANGRFARHIFASGLGGVTHLEFSPGGDLYYTTFAGGGEVHRITTVP